MANILGMSPFQASPIQIISQKICDILEKFYRQGEPIEIEFKYAEFIQFCTSYFTQAQVPPEFKPKFNQMCNYFVFEQSQMHLDTLKKLSCSGLVLLNQLGSRVYKLESSFDEAIHRKFYKMREFLVRLCEQNKENQTSHLGFYSQIQNISMNKTFRVLKQSEIRLDLNVRQGEYAGRYSYGVGEGWIRTRKEDLSSQYDIMMCERTFRLGIKRETAENIDDSLVMEMLNSPLVQKNGIFFRLKRALRVAKNNQVEIALSEVYQPEMERRAQFIDDLKDILSYEPQSLNSFCLNIFQEFYMHEPGPGSNPREPPIKFEVESQFLPGGLAKLNEYRQKRMFKELDRYIETTLHDLYALYFVDHNTKMRETQVMGEMLRAQGKLDEKFPECRLENEFGSYMHEVIHAYVTNK